jgi:hypothetical protein
MEVLNKIFDRRQGAGTKDPFAYKNSPRIPRHSGGWSVLRKRLEKETGLRVIEAGPINATNINFITDLGHSLFLADIVHEAWAGQWVQDGPEGPVWDVQGFLNQVLDLHGQKYDVVLLWTALDYLPEALLAPVVERLYESMNPDGQAFALFHTNMNQEESAHCRFHVTATDDVLEQLAEPHEIQRAFTNRSVERLFSAWGGQKFFLAKDGISEVLFTRIDEE